MEEKRGHKIKSYKSKETYLLQKHRWVILSNKDNINYKASPKYNSFLRMHLDTYDYEKMFFDIDPDLRELRDLKELYIEFNSKTYEDISEADKALSELIEYYKATKYRIFIDFAYLLERYKDGILNSFITYPCQKRSSNKESRLSNGPIESFNRKPKDLVRTARGYANFDHIRNRLLFSTRTNPPILGTPRPLTDFKKKTGKKRGPYNKAD